MSEPAPWFLFISISILPRSVWSATRAPRARRAREPGVSDRPHQAARGGSDEVGRRVETPQPGPERGGQTGERVAHAVVPAEVGGAGFDRAEIEDQALP